MRNALVVALGAALLATLLPQAGQTATSVCAQSKPDGMKFERKRGLRYGRLSWQAKGHGSRFRVFRNGVVVGQTKRRSMPVRVKPGRLYAFAVRMVRPSGVMANCVGILQQRVRWFAPAKIRKPLVRRTGEATVRLQVARGTAGRRPARRLSRVPQRARPQAGAAPDRAAAPPNRRDVPHRGRRQSTRAGVSVTAAGRSSCASATVLRVRPATSSSTGWRTPRWRCHGARPAAAARAWSATACTETVLLCAKRRRPRSWSATSPRLRTTASRSRPWTAAATSARPRRWRRSRRRFRRPRDGKVHAFMLASTDASFEALQRNYRRIGTLYPTYFNCKRNSSIVLGKDDPLVTAWAKLRRLPVMPRFNCQHPATLHLHPHQPRTRARPRSRR